MKKIVAYGAAVVVALTIAGVAAMAGDDADLLLSADACRQLTAYQPGVDGNAAYTRLQGFVVGKWK